MKKQLEGGEILRVVMDGGTKKWWTVVIYVIEMDGKMTKWREIETNVVDTWEFVLIGWKEDRMVE
jgi:hypothetical protein